MAVALALIVGLATGALVAFLALVRPALAARARARGFYGGDAIGTTREARSRATKHDAIASLSSA